jgi:hypothetical protein
MMHEALQEFLSGFRHDAHPMAMLCGMIGSLAGLLPRLDLDMEDPEQRRLAAIRLIAKVPTIAAACYRYSIGWPNRYPRNNLDYCTRFLHMMFEVPSSRWSCRRWPRRRSTCSSSCTPTTSRTHPPRPCAWSVRPARIPTPASRPASPRCGDRRMAVPTRRC